MMNRRNERQTGGKVFRRAFWPISAIVVLSLLAILSASAAAPASAQVATQDGLDVVHNGAKGQWDAAPKITLTFLEMLGREDDDNYLFFEPNAMAADREGNLYVLDSRNFRVQVFDRNRKFLRSFGRNGQGPGDIGRPESLDVDASGNVYVGDPGNGRIGVFDPTGRWLKAFPVPSTNIYLRVMRNGDILLLNPDLDGGRGLKKGSVPLFRILDGATGKPKRELGQGVYYSKFPFVQGGNRSLMTKDADDNAYIAFLFQNRVSKYAPDGRHLFAADRILPKDKLIDKGLDMFSTINTALDVDAKGRLWVVTCTRLWKKGDLLRKQWINGQVQVIGDKTQTKTDIYEIQVFGPDGVLLQKIPLTHYCDFIKIVGDTLYVLDQDRLGQFYVYRIGENA